jgi:hypothetical protein
MYSILSTHCFVCLSFCFGHCIVYPLRLTASDYPLVFKLLVMALFVLLQFTNSDYSLVFKLLVMVLFVLLRFTNSDYPLVFKLLVMALFVLLWFTNSDYPFGIINPFLWRICSFNNIHSNIKMKKCCQTWHNQKHKTFILFSSLCVIRYI